MVAATCLAMLALAGCGGTSKAAQSTASKSETAAITSTSTANAATTHSAATSTNTNNTDEASPAAKEDIKSEAIIKITNNGNTMTFTLNDSPVASSLLSQLPITVDVTDFSDNEKLFYPEAPLTKTGPTALAKRGTLACFTPWGNLTIFCKDYGDGTDSDLIEVGHITSGEEYIDDIAGQITIENAN